jgi:hypothetical protein
MAVSSGDLLRTLQQFAPESVWLVEPENRSERWGVEVSTRGSLSGAGLQVCLFRIQCMKREWGAINLLFFLENGRFE